MKDTNSIDSEGMFYFTINSIIYWLNDRHRLDYSLWLYIAQKSEVEDKQNSASRHFTKTHMNNYVSTQWTTYQTWIKEYPQVINKIKYQ